MYDHYRKLYLDYLSEPIKHPHIKGATRPRVRNVETWKKIESTVKAGDEIDLDNAFRVSLNDGPQVWIWSDQHFGHKNIIRFSNRPYPNLELMHKCLILNHNDYVEPGDICIWVGDVAFLNDNKANEILDQCNGYKILIVGNHDIEKKRVKKLNFDEVHLLKHVNFDYGYSNNFDFLFTHYPCHNLDNKTFNIHGHEHVAHLYTNTHQHINVNCELHGYKPVNLVTLAEMAKKKQEFRLP